VHANYFKQLHAQYKEKAQFLAVYITEAHAKDEWPVGKTTSFCDQPKCIEDRLSLASTLQQSLELPFPVLVDTMSNQFEHQFAAWPFRFYVLADGEVRFIAQPDPSLYAYDVTKLEDWLKTNL